MHMAGHETTYQPYAQPAMYVFGNYT